MTLDLSAIRSQFPSLNRPAIFLDNPGGTQIAQQSLDRIHKYLIECNVDNVSILDRARNRNDRSAMWTGYHWNAVSAMTDNVCEVTSTTKLAHMTNQGAVKLCS